MPLTLEEAATRLGVDPDVLLGIQDKYREETGDTGPPVAATGPTFSEEDLAIMKEWFEERYGPLNPGAEIPPS